MQIHDLKQNFTNSDNFKFLLDTIYKELVKKNIKHLNKQSKEYIDIVNTVASTVFKHEFSNNSGKPVEEAVYYINNIVIDEAIKYIIRKYPSEPDEPLGNPLVQEKKVIEAKQDVFNVYIEDVEQTFKPCVENVVNVCLNGVYMYNQEFMINDSNNILVFKEIGSNDLITISVDCGNYTKQMLLQEIEELMREHSVGKYFYECYLDNTTDKVIISSEKIHELQKYKTTPHLSFRQLKAKISNNNNKSQKTNNIFDLIYDKSTILGVLGFNQNEILHGKGVYISNNPVKLLKPRKIVLEIEIHGQYIDEPFDCKYIYQQTIFLKTKDDTQSYYPINKSKQFPEGLKISHILVNFNNYNHRGFPYTIDMAITQQNLT